MSRSLTPQNISVPTDEVMDFGDDAGAGLENLSMSERLTPFLRMLQGLSPEVNESKPEYIDGARIGQILDTATKNLYSGKEGVDLIVCARDYHYGAWLPRDDGGGFRGMHSPDEPLVRKLIAEHGRFKKLPFVNDEGESVDLVETGQLYVIYGPAGDLRLDTSRRAIIAFTSTAMPVYQGYLERHANWKWRQADGQMRPAALWSYKWRLTTRSQTNKKGDFFNWNLGLAPPATNYKDALYMRDDPELYAAGKEFNAMYKEGKVKADYTSESADKDTPF